MNEKRLLIIDSDVAHSCRVSEYFMQRQFNIDCASSAGEGLKLAAIKNYDFILIAFELPDNDGLIACVSYRFGGGDSPVIILTSSLEAAVKIESFRAGADDVLIKPADCGELHLRMRAIERRPRMSTSGKHQIGEIEFDPDRRIVKKSKRAIRLSEKECALLNYLFSNANTVFSSAELSSILYGSGASASEDTIRQRVRMLRRKLSMIGAEELVKTIPSCGYVLSSANTKPVAVELDPFTLGRGNNFQLAI